MHTMAVRRFDSCLPFHPQYASPSATSAETQVPSRDRTLTPHPTKMKNLLLSIALLLTSCASIESAATTYSVDTALGLVDPMVGRVVDFDESEGFMDAEDAIDLMEDMDAMPNGALAPVDGPLAMRLVAMADVHDSLIPLPYTRGRLIWLRSADLLRGLVSSTPSEPTQD